MEVEEAEWIGGMPPTATRKTALEQGGTHLRFNLIQKPVYYSFFDIIFDMDDLQRKSIRKYLTQSFSIDEIKIICFDLGIDYEEFSDIKSMLVLDMLRYLLRKNKIEKLNDWLASEGYFNAYLWRI